MLHIEKSKSTALCCQCDKAATVTINDMNFCPKHGDDILIKTVVKCTKALQQVTMKTQLTITLGKKQNG
jgi:hypothetical protein